MAVVVDIDDVVDRHFCARVVKQPALDNDVRRLGRGWIELEADDDTDSLVKIDGGVAKAMRETVAEIGGH